MSGTVYERTYAELWVTDSYKNVIIFMKCGKQLKIMQQQILHDKRNRVEIMEYGEDGV